MKIYTDFIQGSHAWHEARLGIVTASTVGKLITTKTLTVANNDAARTLIATLAAERITGQPTDTPFTRDMERGVLDEPLARDAYAEHYAPVEEVAFITRRLKGGALIGYSPDGLVGDDGLIEIKSRKPHHQVATILAGEVPRDHMAQLQAGLLVTGRDWIDYVSYSGGLPLYVKRVEPDPDWLVAIYSATQVADQRITETIEIFTALTAGIPETEYVDHFQEMY